MIKRITVFACALVCWCGAFAQAPTDSVGLFAVHGGEVTRVQPINYKGTKISKGFMSAKAKLEFEGNSSQNVFTGSARFRFYFGTPAITDAQRYYMFTPNFSVNDFAVARFDVKKQTRYLTTASMSIIGGNTGAKSAEGIIIEATQIHPGVYDVSITGAPGEYCIMHNFRGSGGYGGGIRLYH